MDMDEKIIGGDSQPLPMAKGFLPKPLEVMYRSGFNKGSQYTKADLVMEWEKMGKKEILSPRSFGDNDSTVDVSSGWNAAISAILALIEKV